MNQDGRLASGGERLLQVFVPGLVLLIARSVGNREVVLAALEVAREASVEDNEFRTIGMRSGMLGPIRGNLPREGGVAGKDQDGRAIGAHRRFLARQVGL